MSGGELFLLVAGWVMIVEGLLPLVDPLAWQRAAQAASKLPAETIRRLGFVVVFSGLMLVWMILG